MVTHTSASLARTEAPDSRHCSTTQYVSTSWDVLFICSKCRAVFMPEPVEEKTKDKT